MQSLVFLVRKLLLASAMFAFAPAAMANQCGDISPRLDQLGDQYYDLDDTPKSDLFKQTIKPNELIEVLQSTRFRSGYGERTFCFGTSTLREEVRQFELESFDRPAINSFNEITLKAFEHDVKNKFLHRETVFIPLSQTRISTTGDNGFVVNTRHRQPINVLDNRIGSRGGAHLREIAIIATSYEGGIEINQSIYVNGYLAEWFTWRLDS